MTMLGWFKNEKDEAEERAINRLIEWLETKGGWKFYSVGYRADNDELGVSINVGMSPTSIFANVKTPTGDFGVDGRLAMKLYSAMWRVRQKRGLSFLCNTTEETMTAPTEDHLAAGKAK